jgi:hypothetical protein
LTKEEIKDTAPATRIEYKKNKIKTIVMIKPNPFNAFLFDIKSFFVMKSIRFPATPEKIDKITV